MKSIRAGGCLSAMDKLRIEMHIERYERRMIMSNDMTYTIIFILVFLAFLIREIVRGMDDD